MINSGLALEFKLVDLADEVNAEAVILLLLDDLIERCIALLAVAKGRM